MYKPVYAPFAVTYHGERVAPDTVMLEDYDSLFCEFCRVKISVIIDDLTGIKSFVHTPLRRETVSKLVACPYSKSAKNLAIGSKPPKQTLRVTFAPLRPGNSRRLPCKTTKQNWRCSWCHICWNGEKLCPQCEDWIYAISA
ncbi:MULTISPECIES: putative zinc ribbon protein [Citrobacter]|uniref:putative zinc ribbon protein n=1 Tax=Citrobacter TaxID=544 RepID=UPI0015E9448C|nr:MULTISPECIES: hypothetical protein [Citrobacter]QLR16269.1 hypothetical protein HV352_20515 [Citrobacter sp. RHBSTW-01044]